jgi:methyl-accepting chemotaxis protein
MAADKDCSIIYMHKSIVEMFKVAEGEIRKDRPRFQSGKLLGASIDIFHKQPSQQQEMLDRPTSTHRVTVKLGGRTFALTVAPVINGQGARFCTAVERTDRTSEVAVEGASRGDFRKRVDLTGKAGFFARLGNGMNGLLGATQAGLNEVARVLGALAEGDLTMRITADFEGAFGQLKDDASRTD